MSEHADVAVAEAPVDEATMKVQEKQKEIQQTIERRMAKRKGGIKDLSGRQKVRMVIQIILQIVAAIWTLRDVSRRSESELRGSKRLWTVAAFIQPVGTVAYVLFGRKRG